MVEGKTSETSQKSRLITILGPTATGKTGRAVELAKYFDGEIISADSRQVYKGMDIGTGKDLEEYGEVPFHLIDICEAGEKYNLHKYVGDFHKALNNIITRRKVPIICGGTGMYLETVLSGIRLPDVPENKDLRSKLAEYSLDELTTLLSTYKNLHNITDVDTIKRAIRAIEIEEYYCQHPEEADKANRQKTKPLDSLIIGIDITVEKRRERISKRLFSRLEQGMVIEVEKLLAKGIPAEDLIYYGLEYKYLTLFVIGQLSYNEMVRQLEIAIHQFAKRQMTWFRGMERRGFKIHWIPYDLPTPDFISSIVSLLNRN